MIKSLKNFIITFGLSFLLCSPALSDATLLPNAKQQFFDNSGRPLSSGKVYFYVPSTSTPKTTWQDSSQSTPNTNPVILDSSGRATIYGDGSYRQVLKTSADVTIWDALTASTGSGGSSSSGGDGLRVGTILPFAGITPPSNYALAYGQAISRATYDDLLDAITISDSSVICLSGSTTIGGWADTSQIKTGAPIEASCLSPGTTVATIVDATTITVSAVATTSASVSARVFPWGNGDGALTFNVPDLRGRVLAGRDNMGGTSASVLTSTYYGTAPVLGAAGGSQSHTLTSAQSGQKAISAAPVAITDPGHAHSYLVLSPIGGGSYASSAPFIGVNVASTTGSSLTGITATFTLAASNAGSAHPIVQPSLIFNYIIKVLPDAQIPVGATTVVCSDLADSGPFCNGTDASNLTGLLPAAVFPPTAFAVNKNNSNQTISNNSFTLVTFSTEVYDRGNTFASNRHTPTVAGIYSYSVGLTWNTAVNGSVANISLYKNGVEVARNEWIMNGTATQGVGPLTAQISMNGTTDYVEVFARQITGGNLDINGGTTVTWFQGALLERL